MALFDYMFGQPSQEEKEQQQREAYKNLLRGKTPPVGPPEPTLGDIAGREYYQPPPEQPKLGMADSLAAAGAFGLHGDVRGPGRQMPQAPDIPVPEIDVGATAPFGAPPPPPAAVPPGAAPARPTALPQATAATPPRGPAGFAPGSPAAAAAGAPPVAPVDPLQAEIDALEKRRQDAMLPPDMKSMQETYEKQQDVGHRQLMLAAMAEQAKMQPFAAQHLKQSAEARAPMKMAGGTMTESGFIEDPVAKQEMKMKHLEAQILQKERIQASRASLADKQQARVDAANLKRELASERQDFLLAMKRAGGGGKDGKDGEGKILPPKTITDIAEGKGTAQTISRLHSEFKPEYAGVKGTVMEGLGKVPFVSTPAAGWWRNYRKEAELIERHGLFGATLTGPESEAWRAADISPTMAPADIQANLARRSQILTDKYNEMVQLMGTSGYNVGAFPQMQGGGGRRASDKGGGEVDFSALPP